MSFRDISQRDISPLLNIIGLDGTQPLYKYKYFVTILKLIFQVSEERELYTFFYSNLLTQISVLSTHYIFKTAWTNPTDTDSTL